MYSLYMAVKDALHWIAIIFRDFSNIIYKNMSFTCYIVAMQNDTPFLFSLLIYLYDTYYAAGLVMDIRPVF